MKSRSWRQVRLLPSRTRALLYRKSNPLCFPDEFKTPERIPRDEVEQLFDLLNVEALKIDPDLRCQLTGPYRRLVDCWWDSVARKLWSDFFLNGERGAADCEDIDVLITRGTSDGKTHQGWFPSFYIVVPQRRPCWLYLFICFLLLGILSRLIFELHRKSFLIHDVCSSTRNTVI